MSISAATVANLVNQGLVTATLFPKNKLGSITIDVLIEAQHVDTLETTESPVEQGSAITDHSFMRPFEVALKCGWSNSSVNGLLGTQAASLSFGSQPTVNDYVSGVYSQLRTLQQSGQPFDIVTPLRTYQNMILRELSVTRDQTTSQAILVTAACRQIIIAQATGTKLPPQSSQKNPASTAELYTAGVVNLQPATPGPGGSVPSSSWTPTQPGKNA